MKKIIISTLLVVLGMLTIPKTLDCYASELDDSNGIIGELDSLILEEKNIYDQAGLLGEEEEIVLQERIDEFLEEEKTALYIVTVDDHRAINDDYDPWYAAKDFYSQYELGYGEEKAGILLMLSMEARDYAFISYGEDTNSFFDDKKKIEVEEEFLEEFANDYWYEGFESFVEETDFQYKFFWMEEVLYFIAALIIAFCISLGIAKSEKNKLISVKIKADAGEYLTENGVTVDVEQDNYIRTTTNTVRINTSSGSSSTGGRSRSGGGFSGRSGKF